MKLDPEIEVEDDEEDEDNEETMVSGPSTAWSSDQGLSYKEVWRFPKKYPHECPNCRRTFKYDRNLIRHRKFDCGGVKLFQCNFCPNKYSYRYQLTHHFRKKHNLPTTDSPV